MRFYFLLIFMVLCFGQIHAQCDPPDKQKKETPKAEGNMSVDKVKFEKLPDNARLDDEVREIAKNEAGEIIQTEIITVEQKLLKLGARYENEKLVDRDGKEIRFYRPPVRGASQGFEEDKKQSETDARVLAELQEKYTVIILYVNPLKAL